MQCATMSQKLNIKQQVPFIVCRTAEPSGALERVKGKRVQIPHDLVTVIGSLPPGCSCTGHWNACSGKAAVDVELSARKPARCWYGSIAPDHEELVVPEKLMENPGVFLRCRSAHRKTLVFLWQFCLQSCCAWVLFPVPVFQQMDLP